MPTPIYNNVLLGYSILKKDNTFIITKTGINNVFVSLSRQDSCQGDTFVQIISSQQVLTSTIIKLPIVDGLYKLSITVNNITNVYEFPYYDNLLLSIISDVEQVLCGCDCKDCGNCGEIKEKDLTSVLLKIMSYYIITKRFYSGYLDKTFDCLECSIADANQCLLIHEKVLGNKENLELFKRIISTFYLSFYFANKVNAVEEDINSKFKFNKIKQCIISSGINTDCIENSINNMATFSITSEQYINQPPSHVGNISMNVTNRAITPITLAHFTTATTPAYSDPENDPVQAVRIDSLPQDGVLQFNNSGTWTNVTVGQIILASDLPLDPNTTKLRYVSPNQNALDTDTFNFSLRDTGSMTFVS